MDSLSKLRECFSAASAADREVLCVELLRKLHDGFLVPWLERCAETQALSGTWRLSPPMGEESGDLSGCLAVLKGEADCPALSPEGQKALCRLCGVDPALIKQARAASSKREKALDRARGEISSQISRQSWYANDERVQRELEGIRNEWLVVDSESLHAAINRAARERAADPVDVYLCETGHPFVIRGLKNLRRLRLVGLGNPLVKFSPMSSGEILDLEASELRFARLRIDCQHVRLCNERTRCRDCTWI